MSLLADLFPHKVRSRRGRADAPSPGRTPRAVPRGEPRSAPRGSITEEDMTDRTCWIWGLLLALAVLLLGGVVQAGVRDREPPPPLLVEDTADGWRMRLIPDEAMPCPSVDGFERHIEKAAATTPKAVRWVVVLTEETEAGRWVCVEAVGTQR